MLTPETEAELAEILASAKDPLCIQGGGTRGLVLPGEALSVSALSGVSLYEPGALTLVAAAGTPMQEITQTLKQENQRLAFEPMDPRGLLGTSGTPTLGGAIAVNASGPRRIQAGAARDFMLGVRFVDGTGKILKNGGRVMKNVTGYDLVKLMTGAHGTLGVMTEVALKVMPQPETQAAIALEGLSVAQAVDAMSDALASPFEVTGAAHVPGAAPEQAKTWIRIEGFEGSVRYRTDQLCARLARHGPITVETAPEACDALWVGIRDVAVFHQSPGDIWRVSCKPSAAPDLVHKMQAEAVALDWGGGLVWALTAPGTDLRAQLGAYDGHATLVRADAQTRARLGVFQPQPAPVEALSAGLRARFDPRGILNKGLMDAPQLETA